ncbi:MAG: F0F1 ATP synthase subunit epsilon [Legionellales bacterium]|nr:F0F1 ATP synthase subunit epsilon [Legionellales bacterium]
MAKTIKVNIVSLEESIYSGEASWVQASCQKGDVGIYPGHAPYLTQLSPGPVRVVLSEHGHEDVVFVSGGILEVQPDVVTILADTVLRGTDMEEQALLKAKEEAARLLTEQKTDIDYSHAKAELLRAAAMLRTLKMLRKEIK